MGFVVTLAASGVCHIDTLQVLHVVTLIVSSIPGGGVILTFYRCCGNTICFRCTWWCCHTDTLQVLW